MRERNDGVLVEDGARSVAARLERYCAQRPSVILMRLERHCAARRGGSRRPAAPPTVLAGLGDLKPRLQLTSVDRIDHALSQELVGLVVLTIAGFAAIAAFAIFDPATAVAVDLALTVPGLRAVSKRRTFGMRWVLGCLIGLALGRLS